jgi:diguanylate cyclase (GGDEF)-like protein
MAGRIRDSEHMLAELAHRDGLTGLLNRRAFDEALPEMLGRAERLGETISLLAFDIDHFKRVNDTYGHAAGDDVLKALAQIVRDQLRPIDRVFRTGGEEFAALLAGTDAGGAVEAAERLRQAIKARTVRIAGAEIGVTVSVGVAAITGTSSPDVLTGAADAALYRAKRGGRDRVVVADEAEERLQVA